MAITQLGLRARIGLTTEEAESTEATEAIPRQYGSAKPGQIRRNLMIGFGHLVLIVAAFLCTLVAGFLFAFAIVIMPGIRDLSDKDYLRAFQVMDRVIQQNQPLFILVWMGSAVAVVAVAGISLWQFDLVGQGLTISAAAIYILGVQGPTMTINIPLNNQVQRMDLEETDAALLQEMRAKYETTWVGWNTNRTIVSSVVSLLLLVALGRL